MRGLCKVKPHNSYDATKNRKFNDMSAVCMLFLGPATTERLPPVPPEAWPANARLALAHSSGSRLSAFGLRWEDASGQNNGHFAPFAWKGA